MFLGLAIKITIVILLENKESISMLNIPKRNVLCMVVCCYNLLVDRVFYKFIAYTSSEIYCFFSIIHTLRLASFNTIFCYCIYFRILNPMNSADSPWDHVLTGLFNALD